MYLYHKNIQSIKFETKCKENIIYSLTCSNNAKIKLIKENN
jgi:hypothetical protein